MPIPPLSDNISHTYLTNEGERSLQAGTVAPSSSSHYTSAEPPDYPARTVRAIVGKKGWCSVSFKVIADLMKGVGLFGK
jgi:hypothetical protein